MFQLINEILQHRSPEPNTFAYVLEGMWVILTVNTWLLSALPVFKNLSEQHQNKYTIKGETDRQSRLDAWDKCSGLVHWEDPEGWDGEGGGRGDRDGEHM